MVFEEVLQEKSLILIDSFAAVTSVFDSILFHLSRFRAKLKVRMGQRYTRDFFPELLNSPKLKMVFRELEALHVPCMKLTTVFGLTNSIASGKWLFLIEQYSGPAMELRELARGDLGLRWMVTHEHGNVVDII